MKNTKLVAMTQERQIYLVVNLLEMIKKPYKAPAYCNTRHCKIIL
ncbi:unnamed protein product [Tenebrio molitor]|nr:unnamed protein product [Tenebrio molitor]